MSEETKPTSGETAAPKVEFKKLSNFNRRRGMARKTGGRSSSESSSNDDNAKESVIVRAKKDRRKNVLFQATGGYQKKMRLTGGDSDEKSSESDGQTAKVVGVTYKGTGAVERVGPGDLGATSSLQIDTEYDRDETALRKKAIELNKQMKDKTDDKTYRGLKNYQQFYEKKDSVLGNAGSGLNTKGPVRASGNIRATVRWDYEPCICKDYKETGFCGFGDSCKFLHDRSDYKMGWQIERQMEEGTYHPEDMSRYIIESSSSESEGEDLPFRCFICRESFVDPIVTKCNHYFCEKCALDFYQKKSTRCYVCGEPTSGVFNPAKDIVRRIRRVQEKMRQKKAEKKSDKEPISAYALDQQRYEVPSSPEDDDEDDVEQC